MTVEQLNAQWANGNTALHLAAVLHNADAVKLLLERGADATVWGFGRHTHEQPNRSMFTRLGCSPIYCRG